jgi:hypothetical protein
MSYNFLAPLVFLGQPALSKSHFNTPAATVFMIPGPAVLANDASLVDLLNKTIPAVPNVLIALDPM